MNTVPKIAYKKLRPEEPAFKPVKRKKDADYDLFASGDTLCKAGELTLIPLNIAIEFPDGWEGKVETKSGVGKKGMTVYGGVIDNIYIGEIIVMMANTSKSDYLFKSGHKVAQMKLREVSPEFEFEEVTRELKTTERGDGKWGSTGL